MARRVFITVRTLLAVTALVLTTLALTAPRSAVAAPVDGGSPPPSTFNEFYPEERPIGDCLGNSIPLPNCGSDARGGWAQTVVLVAILAALAFIAWRIVAASRAARSERERRT